MTELLTARGYARHRRAAGLPGGALRAVQKAITTGRIMTDQDGRLNPAAADRQWAACTSPRVFARLSPRGPAGAIWAPTPAQATRWRAARTALHRLHLVLGDDVDDLIRQGHLIGDGPPRLDAVLTAHNALVDAIAWLDEALAQYTFASPRPAAEET